jgi:hypothetical protein
VTTELTTPWPDNEIDAIRASSAAEPLRGGDSYARLHHAQRLFLDRLAGAAFDDDPELAARITDQLIEFAGLLDAHQVPELERWDGWRPDLPGRGMALLPPYVIDGETDTTLRGHVTFGRFYLGGNGAAHGGSQPLLFDDMLGRLVNHGRAGVARTAYLKVNYRRITPIAERLEIFLSVDKEDGRKRWCTGTLSQADGTVVSDVEALFVSLLPGQP